MKNFAWLMLAAASATGCACSPETTGELAKVDVERPRQPDFVQEAGIDQDLMERAIGRARATQNEFVAALQNQRPEASDFFIKRQLGNQHVWLEQVEWDGQSFFAAVSAEQIDATQSQVSGRIEVRPDELTDWMYVEDGILRGGYTVRVLHYQSSPEQQRATLRSQDFTIPPIDF
jgi:uncharacterized protein YegJ (DUF2314 family)